MKEYMAKGRLTLDGVEFYLFAKDEVEAKRRFANGEYDAYDQSGAEPVFASIEPASTEEYI